MLHFVKLSFPKCRAVQSSPWITLSRGIIMEFRGSENLKRISCFPSSWTNRPCCCNTRVYINPLRIDHAREHYLAGVGSNLMVVTAARSDVFWFLALHRGWYLLRGRRFIIHWDGLMVSFWSMPSEKKNMQNTFSQLFLAICLYFFSFYASPFREGCFSVIPLNKTLSCLHS